MKKTLLPIGLMTCFVLRTLSQTGPSSNDDLSKQIVGEWRNTYVKIVIHHKNDPAKTMEADSSNWEARLGIKPIRTHFKDDGTYYSEYRNLKDSVVRRPAGVWMIKGDTITMTQQVPDKNILKVHLTIDKNVATFSGLIDFDGEGIANDDYLGRQRKFIAQ